MNPKTGRGAVFTKEGTLVRFVAQENFKPSEDRQIQDMRSQFDETINSSLRELSEAHTKAETTFDPMLQKISQAGEKKDTADIQMSLADLSDARQAAGKLLEIAKNQGGNAFVRLGSSDRFAGIVADPLLLAQMGVSTMVNYEGSNSREMTVKAGTVLPEKASEAISASFRGVNITVSKLVSAKNNAIEQRVELPQGDETLFNFFRNMKYIKKVGVKYEMVRQAAIQIQLQPQPGHEREFANTFFHEDIHGLIETDPEVRKQADEYLDSKSMEYGKNNTEAFNALKVFNAAYRALGYEASKNEVVEKEEFIPWVADLNTLIGSFGSLDKMSAGEIQRLPLPQDKIADLLLVKQGLLNPEYREYWNSVSDNINRLVSKSFAGHMQGGVTTGFEAEQNFKELARQAKENQSNQAMASPRSANEVMSLLGTPEGLSKQLAESKKFWRTAAGKAAVDAAIRLAKSYGVKANYDPSSGALVLTLPANRQRPMEISAVVFPVKKLDRAGYYEAAALGQRDVILVDSSVPDMLTAIKEEIQHFRDSFTDKDEILSEMKVKARLNEEPYAGAMQAIQTVERQFKTGAIRPQEADGRIKEILKPVEVALSREGYTSVSSKSYDTRKGLIERWQEEKNQAMTSDAAEQFQPIWNILKSVPDLQHKTILALGETEGSIPSTVGFLQSAGADHVTTVNRLDYLKEQPQGSVDVAFARFAFYPHEQFSATPDAQGLRPALIKRYEPLVKALKTGGMFINVYERQYEPYILNPAELQALHLQAAQKLIETTLKVGDKEYRVPAVMVVYMKEPANPAQMSMPQQNNWDALRSALANIGIHIGAPKALSMTPALNRPDWAMMKQEQEDRLQRLTDEYRQMSERQMDTSSNHVGSSTYAGAVDVKNVQTIAYDDQAMIV
ncbi:MAG: hypothetical protein KGJ11_08700, partial [Candidatus Omnitrophica bacterium]|nr:hypothetical protein [Candidatus Omnitrophota bacterium]